MRQFRILCAVLTALTVFFLAAPTTAHAEVNVYTTPGEHTVNGRQWRTWCEPYSQTARCTTQLLVSGRWTFNNLTYLPAPRSLWTGNPLATPGDHVVAGRSWRTECDTAATGRNGCRSYLWDGKKYVFNNLVLFGALRSDLNTLYGYRPPADPPPRTDAPPSGTYSLTRGPHVSDRVLLTYDDCPKSMSAFRAAVKGAADLGVTLGLFPTGDCVTGGRFDPAYARSLGHYVFNHSISHPDLTTLSYANVVRQLGAPGIVTTYGRPPYGAYNSTVARAYAAVGMRIWIWTLDTHDYRSKTQSQVVSYVVNNARRGDTVLMHLQWNGFNTSAIKSMRDGLAAKGIGLCRNLAPTPVKPAGVQC